MLITGAELADGRVRDVRIRDGTIDAVEPTNAGLDADTGERVVDARGRHLLPGAVDVHVHFREPGASHKETWTSGSRGAAAGGVTTVVDQPNTSPPTVDGDAFDEGRPRRRLARRLRDQRRRHRRLGPRGLFERPCSRSARCSSRIRPATWDRTGPVRGGARRGRRPRRSGHGPRGGRDPVR